MDSPDDENAVVLADLATNVPDEAPVARPDPARLQRASEGAGESPAGGGHDVVERGRDLTLGLDAARQGYWEAYGGSPGITWFVDGLSVLLAERGIDEGVQHTFYVDNPQAAYTFTESPPLRGAPGPASGHPRVVTPRDLTP